MKNKLKKGDNVVMHSCGEADFPKYKGKLWVCECDSFMSSSGSEVVFLEGFSGYFMCKYLQMVNNKKRINDITLGPGETYIHTGDNKRLIINGMGQFLKDGDKLTADNVGNLFVKLS